MTNEASFKHKKQSDDKQNKMTPYTSFSVDSWCPEIKLI